MRIIFFTGKGGVGKSTLSCATAVKMAKADRRVALVSLDLAHNLRDILPETKLKNLRIIEVDPDRELRRNWEGIYTFMRNFIEESGVDEIYSEEMIVLPGMEEILSFLSILDLINSKTCETIVIDGPPTASSLKFLSLPEMLRWVKEKFFGRTARRYLKVKPLLERYFYTSLPDEEFMENFKNGYEKISKLHGILKDPLLTSFRIVAIPSRVTVNETGRLYSTLSLFEYPVDAVIINRITSAFSQEISDLESLFYPIPVFKIPHLEREPLGFEAVEKIAEMVYGERDPEDVFLQNSPVKIKKRGGYLEIEFFLPGIKKEEIEMWVDENELVIKSGVFKRVMFFSAERIEVGRVDFLNGRLNITIHKK